MPLSAACLVRAIDPKDRQAIDCLLATSDWQHAHLDWLAALDLIGQQPFLMASIGNRPGACLACPPDPPGVAWVRAFIGKSVLSPAAAWDAMWPRARVSAIGLGARIAAALTAEPWMEALLRASGFAETNRVVFLEHHGRPGAPALPAGVRLRPYRPSDLQAVCEVDAEAFQGLWRYSEIVLRAALAQAAMITLLEVDGRLAGYQLSTASVLGVHLARLAVRPGFQRRGFGRALVEHLLHEFGRQGLDRVSVNTQQDNLPSLRLYRRLGFQPTRQSYPVYTLTLGEELLGGP